MGKAARRGRCPHRPFPPSRPQAIPPGDTSNKGAQGAGTFCGMSMPSAPRLPGGNQFPPDTPLRSPRGFCSAALRVTSIYGERSGADAPRFCSLGDTSNKGARSLVLTNSGPLRPPVRRTSAPLRCSSSPNGNGRFRWERSRSEISELSPLGGSERCAACGDAFGRWGVVLRRGNTKSPS